MDDDDDDDAYSSCSTVYTVGDVSVITEDYDDDVACLDDIQDDKDVSTDLDEPSSLSESNNRSVNELQWLCDGH